MDDRIRAKAGLGVGTGAPDRGKSLKLLQTAAKTLAVPVLLAGVALAIRIAIADTYARRATVDGLQHAVAWESGNADYHRWLGVALLARDQKRSESEFREALRLNPWDADSRMRLALLHESQGRIEDAKQELVKAAQVDVTFLPRWALANFEFRRNNLPEFWTWARAAVQMSYGDRTPIFDLAAATGETRLAGKLGLEKDEMWLTYLGWALEKATADEIRTAAMHVAGGRHPNVRLLSQSCNRLIDLGKVEAALDVWNAGVASNVITVGRAARGRITNPKFAVDTGESGFDWALNNPNGGSIAKGSDSGGLRIHFNGEQNELCSVLAQRIAVLPGASYRILIKFRTIEMSRNNGLRWTVSTQKGPLVIQEKSLWAEEGGVGELSFRVPNEVGLVKLELVYQRPQGEVRSEGTVLLESAEMKVDHPSP